MSEDLRKAGTLLALRSRATSVTLFLLVAQHKRDSGEAARDGQRTVGKGQLELCAAPRHVRTALAQRRAGAPPPHSCTLYSSLRPPANAHHTATHEPQQSLCLRLFLGRAETGPKLPDSNSRRARAEPASPPSSHLSHGGYKQCAASGQDACTLQGRRRAAPVPDSLAPRLPPCTRPRVRHLPLLHPGQVDTLLVPQRRPCWVSDACGGARGPWRPR